MTRPQPSRPSRANWPPRHPCAPVPLIKEFQREQAYKGDREVEIPIKVTVTDTPADSGEVPAPSNGQANSAWNSPLLWQTARVDYGDLEDSGAPSATMSDYITTEAILDETPAEPSEPSELAAAAPEVAALQSIAPTGTEAGIERIYAVQLASYLSEERAMRGWTELRAIAPDLLDPLEPVVRRADLDDDESTVYRLRTAPATKDDAKPNLPGRSRVPEPRHCPRAYR